jgi:hypothetical protein
MQKKKLLSDYDDPKVIVSFSDKTELATKLLSQDATPSSQKKTFMLQLPNTLNNEGFNTAGDDPRHQDTVQFHP